MIEMLAAFLPQIMSALGIGGAGAAGGGMLSSILGGLGGAAAPMATLPAATAGTGIASASPELLNAVGLPDLAGGAGAAAPEAGGFSLGNILKTGGQALDVAGKAKQLTAPTVAPPQPAASTPSSGGAGAAPPVSFGGGGDDAYASQLQKILKQHTSSGMGGGY